MASYIGRTKPREERQRIIVTLPQSLLLTIQEYADNDERPRNAEIVRLLRAAVAQRQGQAPVAPGAPFAP
jgi:metal-responsive CopG/Arc/MetJ family transcriptional regulator